MSPAMKISYVRGRDFTGGKIRNIFHFQSLELIEYIFAPIIVNSHFPGAEPDAGKTPKFRSEVMDLMTFAFALSNFA